MDPIPLHRAYVGRTFANIPQTEDPAKFENNILGI